MIDRTEFRAQAARLQLSNTDIASATGVSANTVRSFMKGADARISVLCKIAQALGGEIHVSFRKVSDSPLPGTATTSPHARLSINSNRTS